MTDQAENLTQLLRRLSSGDEEAAAQVAAAAYGELRKLAARFLRRERSGHTLQPTALVHEAFLKLLANTRAEWRDRAQFYAVAARLMRRILVDYARKRSAARRGGGQQVSLHENLILREDRIEDVMAVDEALTRLEALDPRQGRIVELRFFSGLTTEEIAEVLHISTPTVKREWSSAKAWLHRELSAPSRQAQRYVEIVRDTESLDLLARALERNGKAAEAAKVEAEALAMLPPAKPGRPIPQNRRKLEARLDRMTATSAPSERQARAGGKQR